MAFHAGVGSVGGIYLTTPSGYSTVVTTAMPVPNGGGANFSNIWQASHENGRVAFAGWASGDGQRGVYSWQNSTLSVIADKSTPIPGGSGTFTSFSEARLSGDQVLLQGRGAGSYNGLFLADKSGAITRLYDTNTPIPGASGSFSFLSLTAFSAGRVAFYGQGAMAGVYSDISGQLDVIADLNTPAPGFPGQTFG